MALQQKALRSFDNIKFIERRVRAYSETAIDFSISQHEDMFAFGAEEAMSHYQSVGRSAVDAIVRALFSAQKSDFHNVLDLPCGGGRVTRHLCALFPEAAMHVGDINPNKVEAVTRAFNASPVQPGPRFTEPSATKFDLIWVGSLFTHLGDQFFREAFKWYVDALANDGLLIITLHGRTHEYRQTHHSPHVAPEVWGAASESFHSEGFGFIPYEPASPEGPYAIGTTVTSPAWIMRLVEERSDIRIVSYEEAGWVGAHDLLVVQRRPIGQI